MPDDSRQVTPHIIAVHIPGNSGHASGGSILPYVPVSGRLPAIAGYPQRKVSKFSTVNTIAKAGNIRCVNTDKISLLLQPPAEVYRSFRSCLLVFRVGRFQVKIYRHGKLFAFDDIVKPFCIGFRSGLSLIVQFFALAQTDFHFYPTALEIQGQGDQRVTVQLNGLSQLNDLSLVHQQLSGADGILVENVALFIGAYMHSDNEKLAVFDRAV